MSTPTPSIDPNEPRPIRPATVAWGVILLVVAALAALTTYLRPLDYTPAFWLWGILVVGGLLVVAGIVGAIVRATSTRRRQAAADDKARFAAMPDVSPAPASSSTPASPTPTRPYATEPVPDDSETTDVRDLFR